MPNPSPYYENIEFNVTTATTDYDVDVQQSTFLSNFNDADHMTGGKFPTYMSFRTDNTVTISINGTGNHDITITSSDSPFVIDGLEIQNVFITNNSGNTAAIKMYLQYSPHANA